MRRHTEELKEIIGEWLRRDPGRGKLKILAESLQVSPKTLNNWKRKRPRRSGRPRYTDTQRKAAMLAVGRELRRQGYPGEKAIERELPHVPLRLIREYVRLFKARRRKRLDLARRARRESIVVKAKGAILVQDGAHLGRNRQGVVEAQIAKDRGSLRIERASVGPQTEAHVIEFLEEIRMSCGLPLVLGTDNGPCYVSDQVKEYLARHQVVHLASLPHTPQHNGAAERAVRELKEASGLGKGVCVSERAAKIALERAAARINANRYRAKISSTADAMDERLPPAYNLVNRNLFYAECKAAMCEAALASVSARRRRMAERNAIYRTLERYGLVEITEGGK